MKLNSQESIYQIGGGFELLSPSINFTNKVLSIPIFDKEKT